MPKWFEFVRSKSLNPSLITNWLSTNDKDEATIDVSNYQRKPPQRTQSETQNNDTNLIEIENFRDLLLKLQSENNESKDNDEKEKDAISKQAAENGLSFLVEFEKLQLRNCVLENEIKKVNADLEKTRSVWSYYFYIVY